jgi:hypothetical protein
MPHHLVDGLLRLPEQENTLNYAEIAGHWRLTNYAKATSTTVDPATGEFKPQNSATFVDDATTKPRLVLVEVKNPNELPQVILDQKAQGRTLVCFNQAYVSGELTNIAVFR